MEHFCCLYLLLSCLIVESLSFYPKIKYLKIHELVKEHNSIYKEKFMEYAKYLWHKYDEYIDIYVVTGSQSHVLRGLVGFFTLSEDEILKTVNE